MYWFHGHMIPTSCGRDWPVLVSVHVFVLLKNRVVFRKSIALQRSYRLIWESRLLPLKRLVSCIICFKRIWEFHALKDLHKGTLHTEVRLVFLWCMVHIAIKITSPFSPPPHPHPQASVLALASHLLICLPSFVTEGWAALCDKTMMPFGRIDQDRLLDTWQCCKVIFF